MNPLAKRNCIPCQGGVPPLKGIALRAFEESLGHGWKVVKDHHLYKVYKCNDFRHALDFVQKVGRLAEKVWHHPEICFGWGKVTITIYTHKVDGLTESDFVLAAKIEEEIVCYELGLTS